MSRAYWIEEDHELLGQARSYGDLLVIAERVIARMPEPVAQVCGPITTGGSGSFESNLATLKEAITSLSASGVSVFDQTPFQERMQLIKDGKQAGEAYDQELLLQFYLPLFERRLIDVLYFIPGWETSVGGRWEHEEGTRLGLPIRYL